MSDANPALLLIQGRLHEGAEATYQKYIEGTGPLMAEYEVEVVGVGAGVESPLTTDAWPVSAVLRFPSRAAAESFLNDPRYREIKGFRDAAYEELRLSLVETRPPQRPSPRAVAEQAFEAFKHGLATGEFGAWFEMMTEDFSFHFPAGKYKGQNEGKPAAMEFFGFVRSVYPEGLFVDEVLRVSGEGPAVVFEFKDHGTMRGEPYNNRVAISLDVRGDKICGYREYFGLV